MAFALELVVCVSTSGWPGLIGPISTPAVVSQCTWSWGDVVGVSGGCGCLRCCTWETEVSANRGPFFVGMTGFSGERRARWSGSHVQRGGSTHMGARPLPLLMLLFRMIPRFPLTRNARECATPTTPGPRRHQWSRPAAVKPDPCDLQPRDIAPRTGVTECDRSRRGVRPISARSATDLDAGYDRSRHGLRPISTRGTTDLGTGCDRSRGGVRPISVRNTTDLAKGGVRCAQGAQGVQAPRRSSRYHLGRASAT